MINPEPRLRRIHFCKQIICMAAVLFLAVGTSNAQTTTIVGGSLLNGDFNFELNDTTGQRTFLQTTNWQNIGTTGNQEANATHDNLTAGDGSRNAIIGDDLGNAFGMNTGYAIQSGDIFNISYEWRDAFNWNDSLDQISVSLFTTDDDSINGVRTDLANSLSGSSALNNTYQTFEQNSVYDAIAADVGKNLFIEVNGLDGNGTTNGFARFDNFFLTEGFVAPPVPGDTNPPSPLTGINLFSDTFDRANSTDNVDAVTTGMSSAVFTPTVGTTYSEFRGSFGTATSDINNNKLELGVGSGESMVGIDRNFIDQEIIDAGGFAIEAIVDPSVGVNGQPDNRFLAIAVGLSQPNATTQTMRTATEGSNADRQILEQGAFTFTIEDDAQYNAFDSYAKDTQAANPGIFVEINNVGQFENAGQTNHDKASVIDDGNGLGQNDFLAQIGEVVEQDEYKIRLEFEFSDFNENSDVVVTAFIEDIQIDLDPSDGIEANPEDRDTYTFQWDGNNQNYIALEGRAAPSSVDFLMIETLVADAIPGDFNNDGTVDAADYTVWRDNEGLAEGTSLASGSGDDSGIVDAGDYSIWVANFGNMASTSSAAAVPEPSAALIITAGIFSLFVRSRRG